MLNKCIDTILRLLKYYYHTMRLTTVKKKLSPYLRHYHCPLSYCEVTFYRGPSIPQLPTPHTKHRMVQNDSVGTKPLLLVVERQK